MSFVSVQFLIFLLIVFVLYYAIPKKYQWVFLLICSYAFYLYGGIKPAIFIVITTFSTFFAAKWMDKMESEYKLYLEEHREQLDKAAKKDLKAKNKARKKKVLIGVMLFNFGLLLLLKYYNFIAGNITKAFSFFEYNIELPLVNIILPLGMSFFIFQSMGYCIDVFRGKTQAETSLAKYALFISFFPQVVQGPISRYNQLGSQLFEEHHFDYTNVKFGLQLMMWGFFKKMVIADRAVTLVNQVFSNYTDYDGAQVLLAILIYTVQIYADFSGGIDITRGVAQVLGIDLVKNFERPYFSTSVGDYWSRWHISLTQWMRDYVFYSLTLSKAMNRLGKWSRAHLKGNAAKQLPSYVTTFTVFFLIGIWHGASWGHIAFGFYNGFVIVLGMICKPLTDFIAEKLHINMSCFSWKLWTIIRTYAVMTIGKTLVKAVSVKDAFVMLGMCVSIPEISNLQSRLIEMGLSGWDWIALFIGCVIFFTVSVLQENGISVRESLAKQNLPVRWAIYAIGLVMILVMGIYGPGYDVAEFVYRNY